MSTYAAYYNLTEADRAEQARRTSAESTKDNSRRSSFQKVFHSFRPTEQEITPSGIYSPIIKRGSLFSRNSSRQGSVKESVEPRYGSQKYESLHYVKKAEKKAASKDIQMTDSMRDLIRGAA